MLSSMLSKQTEKNRAKKQDLTPVAQPSQELSNNFWLIAASDFNPPRREFGELCSKFLL